MGWGDSYIENLRRQSAERQAQRAAQSMANASDVDRLEALKRRIVEWFNSRPREAHPEYYYMADLKRLLGASPQDLGTALHELGWIRRRVWARGQPFRQRWYPPEDSNTATQ